MLWLRDCLELSIQIYDHFQILYDMYSRKCTTHFLYFVEQPSGNVASFNSVDDLEWKIIHCSGRQDYTVSDVKFMMSLYTRVIKAVFFTVIADEKSTCNMI
jgi:hypothetical protein